jgi:hypothetical protein
VPNRNWANYKKHPKIFFQRYLRNIDEPRDISDRRMPPELEAELMGDSYVMRRRFRLIAKTLRDYF